MQKKELKRDGWSLSPYTLVRSTGFPFELLDALNCPATVAMLDNRNAMHEQESEEVFAGECASLLDYLRTLIEREDVREAIYVSSPNAFASLRLPPATTPLRARERKLLKHIMLYLQRFTTKCDTNSFFGPTWWGEVGQSQTMLAFAAPEHFAIVRRHVLWTHWAVTALAQALSSEEETGEFLPLYPAAGLAIECRSDTGCIAWLTDFAASPPETRTAIPLDEIEAELLTICLRKPQGIYRSELTDGDAARRLALDALIEKGLVRAQVEIPSGLMYPLSWLAAFVQRQPEISDARWLPVVARLDGMRQQYEAGDLAARRVAMAGMTELFESACQRSATRGAGAFYSDRVIVCEEAERNWQRCDLGKPLLEHITGELLPSMYVLLDTQYRRHQMRQAAAARWFSSVFTDEKDVPLLRFLAVADNDTVLQRALLLVDEAIEPYSAELGNWLCQGQPERRRSEISPSALLARAGNVRVSPCVVNPDLMIGARSVDAINHGDYYLVLGELHMMQDLTVHGSPVVAHPDKEGAVAAAARQYARIVPNMTIAEPVMEHTDKTKVMLPHSLLQIEFSGRALPPVAGEGEAGLDAPRVLRAGELVVRRKDDTLVLAAPGFDAIMLTRTPVWTPFNRTSILNIFAFPHSNRLGGQLFQYPSECRHFPRVTVGSLVIHRETWWMNPCPAWKREQGYSLSAWRELRRWRDEQGVPERVFVHFRDEPKPVFLDFRNPLLVNWFVRKIACADHAAQITELLPDAGNLWLQDDRGHYCCEFRMTLYLDGHVPNSECCPTSRA